MTNPSAYPGQPPEPPFTKMLPNAPPCACLPEGRGGDECSESNFDSRDILGPPAFSGLPPLAWWERAGVRGNIPYPPPPRSLDRAHDEVLPHQGGG
jgi:hypothetical protein